MTHPIPIPKFREKLEKLISVNAKIINPKVKLNLIKKMSVVSERHPSRPGEPNLDNIKSVSEVAFQRGIFNSVNSRLIKDVLNEDKIIDWIDMEIPVVLNKNRRRSCIDLMGSVGNKLVLCELKFSKPGSKPSDSPMYAVFELLLYYYYVRCNFKELDELGVFHDLPSTKNFNWEKYLKNCVPLLLVTANSGYWEYWFKKKNYKVELLQEISVLEKELQIEIQLFQTVDEDFFEQKRKSVSETYSPKVASNIWTNLHN